MKSVTFAVLENMYRYTYIRRILSKSPTLQVRRRHRSDAVTPRGTGAGLSAKKTKKNQVRTEKKAKPDYRSIRFDGWNKAGPARTHAHTYA